MMGRRVSLVLPDHVRRELEAIARLTGDDLSTLMRRLLAQGLERLKLDLAVERYVKKQGTLEQAMRFSGVSMWRFLDELRARRVGLHYTLEEAEVEIQRILRRGSP